jgi:hypothetical protein
VGHHHSCDDETTRVRRPRRALLWERRASDCSGPSDEVVEMGAPPPALRSSASWAVGRWPVTCELGHRVSTPSRLGVAIDRRGVGGARLAGTELADDLSAVAARIVDPLAAAAAARRMSVDAGARRIVGRPGLDDDTVTTGAGKSYGSTEVASKHSLRQPEVLSSFSGSGRTTWSGIPDSNWRPSAWEMTGRAKRYTELGRRSGGLTLPRVSGRPRSSR